ncbi:MAG: transglycosylase domain-containing protein [Stappiaceae bacterium]
MAQRKKRIEPKFGASSKEEGSLNLRLSSKDRPSASGSGRRAAKPGPKPGGRKKTTSSRKKASGSTARRRGGSGRSGGGSGRGRGGRKRRGSLLVRFFRRSIYWTTVMGIWCVLIFGGLLAYHAAHLPPTSEWNIPKRPPNVKIVSVEGHLIGNRGDTGGEAIRLEQIPPYLPQAVKAIEDRRFRYHPGVDPIGLTRAMASNVMAGRMVQGGSTITQQLAKNLFLKPERTLSRKMQELVLAFWLEARLSKDEIMELYLNRVYFGAGAYGVDAASRRYFGKSVRNISLAEAATLAGLLKAPSRYSPARNPKLAEKRARLVLAAMEEEKYISGRELKIAKSNPARAIGSHNRGSVNYAADWVMEILPGYVGSIKEDIIVDTTIDMDLQLAAERAMRSAIAEKGGPLKVSQGAVVSLNTSGAVRVMIGGTSYADSQYNRAVLAKRQPGSAFKPFVYLAALERGLTPQTVRTDQRVSIKGWTPSNYTKKYYGPVTLSQALSYSLNTVAAQLAYEVGPQTVANTAQRLGVRSPLNATPSIALGTSEVTPLEITAAYVPFSNGGYGVVPYVIRRIRTETGTVLYERNGSGPGQVVDPRHVGMMNAMMSETLLAGTGKKAQLPGWPAGGKTGTSQKFRDAWFIGYTAELTTGVWLGNDDGSPTNKATGGSMPAVIWQDYMAQAHRGLQVAELPGAWAPQRTRTAAVPVRRNSNGESWPPRGNNQRQGSSDDDWKPAEARRDPIGGLFKRLFGS